jgi:hypothetical protein
MRSPDRVEWLLDDLGEKVEQDGANGGSWDKASVVFDLTGGTVPMSLAMLRTAANLGVECVYMSWRHRGMRLRNLTPHPVTISTDAGSVHCPAESGARPRIDEAPEAAEPLIIDGVRVPTVRISGGPVVGLPDPAPGTLLLVSRIVAEAARGRTDLVVPYDLIRDDAGRVIGCRSLGRVTAEVRS